MSYVALRVASRCSNALRADDRCLVINASLACECKQLQHMVRTSQDPHQQLNPACGTEHDVHSRQLGKPLISTSVANQSSAPERLSIGRVSSRGGRLLSSGTQRRQTLDAV